MTTKIARPSLTDLAYQALVEAIYDRTYPPGASVSIDRLAEQLGISATPVREALVRATSRRLLTQQSNKGFWVAPLLRSEEYHQLFEARRLLELHAVAGAQLTDAGVERLAEAQQRMRTVPRGPSYADVAAYNTADRDFHAVLVGFTPNVFVADAWDNLHHHLHISRLYTGTGVVDSTEALAEHQTIIDAARAHDRDALLAAVQAHIDGAEQRLASRLPALRSDSGS